jgi:hypothetical protein
MDSNVCCQIRTSEGVRTRLGVLNVTECEETVELDTCCT